MVVDPGVPPQDAALLRGNQDILLRMREGWKPETADKQPTRSRRQPMLILGAAGLLVVLFAAGATRNPLVVLVALGAAFGLLVRALLPYDVVETNPAEEQVYRLGRLYYGRYLLPGDLDSSSQRLLSRAQRAVHAVSVSEVNGRGLLDGVRNAVMLPAEEWEIARLLAKLSSLRSRHQGTVAGGVTPEVAAIAEPLTAALNSSEAAVLALELYAANVAEADLAYRAQRQIAEMRERLPEFEELVAESGADRLAVPEIAGLAQEADQLEQALRRSIGSARDAFKYLGD
ncbi:MAG: hypothetical protein HOY71_33495 [Nonomuraea sp.]|nr:hypothetical protein [Nonomuraea sp.]